MVAAELSAGTGEPSFVSVAPVRSPPAGSSLVGSSPWARGASGGAFASGSRVRCSFSGGGASRVGGVGVGARVNLERAAAINSRLGGHIVQGHVDGTGHVVSRTPSEHWTVVRIALPVELSRYVVQKGSITVDGVSLTVSGLGHDWFEVSLIPTTLELTTLGHAEVGSPVNLEVDVIAKYVERLLEKKDVPAGE